MRFALEVRQGRERALEFAEVLKGIIVSSGGEVVDADEPDMVLAVGGDGTMLAAVQLALRSDVPVLGFNLGTVGFLTEAEPDQVETVVQRLLTGDYQLHERMTIDATVNGRTATGVNDVVVEKVDSQRLIDLDVTIDGSRFLTYRADGLIVSTPTGSTAYSFSAGGPLVDPDLDAMVLSPVAAHSLFDRPLVVPASRRIEVTVVTDRPVKVSVDKNSLGNLALGDRVLVTRGSSPARFVTFGERSFPSLLTEKFGLR
ncbi:MAG TPA: NAD(+)/NADH kinase [Acidimicrobiia bacterium]|nr:NAD(+)/NADH kinase [Acidimicrobiia bacterium]